MLRLSAYKQNFTLLVLVAGVAKHAGSLAGSAGTPLARAGVSASVWASVGGRLRLPTILRLWSARLPGPVGLPRRVRCLCPSLQP